MTRCRWSYDSRITASGLIKAYVNKSVSYVNPNHIKLVETITTDEQQEEECWTPVSHTGPSLKLFSQTLDNTVWKTTILLPHGFVTLAGSRVQQECTHALFSLTAKHAVFTDSENASHMYI